MEKALLVEERTETARCAFMHNKIDNALEDNNNFWAETRKLGLFPTTDDALHGFSPDELNTNFLLISIFSLEDPDESHDIISTANGVSFKPVTTNDVILAVAHFKLQARGENGTPISIVAKALPTIANLSDQAI